MRYRVKPDVFFAAHRLFAKEAANEFESGCCSVVDRIAERQADARCREHVQQVFDEEYLRGLFDGFDGARRAGPRYKQGIVDGIAIADESVKRGECDYMAAVLWNVLALIAKVLNQEFSVVKWDGTKRSFLIAANSKPSRP